MSLFTPVQLRVMKTAWALPLISLVLTSLPAFFLVFMKQGPNFVLQIAGLLYMLSWEFVIKKEWRNVLILSFVAIAAFGLQYYLDKYLFPGNTDRWFILNQVNAFTAYVIVIVARFHLAGMGDRLMAGLVAAVIFFFAPQDGMPFSKGMSAITGGTMPGNPLYAAVIILPLAYFKTICYYVIIFLSENCFKTPRFLVKLQSKVQVTDRWEYFFVMVSVYFVYMGGIGELSRRTDILFEGISSQAEQAYTILHMLTAAFFLYLGAILLRNIITARALTTGRYSPWLLLLHLTPGLNLVAIALCFFSKNRSATREENVVHYAQAKRQVAQYIIIAAGIIVTCYNIYTMLIVPTGLRLAAISVLAGLYLLKIFAYLKLPSGRIFVYLVTGLNVITVAYSLNEQFFIYLGLIYLYYYFLIELFHPQLEAEDTLQEAGRPLLEENEWEHGLG